MLELSLDSSIVMASQLIHKAGDERQVSEAKQPTDPASPEPQVSAAADTRRPSLTGSTQSEAESRSPLGVGASSPRPDPWTESAGGVAGLRG